MNADGQLALRESSRFKRSGRLFRAVDFWVRSLLPERIFVSVKPLVPSFRDSTFLFRFRKLSVASGREKQRREERGDLLRHAELVARTLLQSIA